VVNHPGNRLRIWRENLGFTMRDVENSSVRLAGRHKNAEYEIPVSRLSDIETKDVIPSIHRVYALAVIYRLDFCEILSWYGIDLENIPKDLSVSEPPKTHRIEAVSDCVSVPMKLDPSFDVRKTTNLARMIEQWGTLPFAELQKLSVADYTYGYIGTDDFTMYPLLLPGSFVQVDETKNEVVEGVWRTEYERPIYFVETREGYTCTWVSIKGDAIILQPHPLSPVRIRVLRHEREAEVIGQVVGVAMRLDRHQVPECVQEQKALAKPN
jgi:transcriptional regulator with XRE-family HTH domain